MLKNIVKPKSFPQNELFCLNTLTNGRFQVKRIYYGCPILLFNPDGCKSLSGLYLWTS